jgi:hypothetical protein
MVPACLPPELQVGEVVLRRAYRSHRARYGRRSDRCLLGKCGVVYEGGRFRDGWVADGGGGFAELGCFLELSVAG